MRRHEVEAWILSVADLVKSGRQNEDSRVELKAEWIDPYEAARRIAGHANAARGAEILWIIGLHPDDGVVGAKDEDLAQWWPQVESQFDGQPPELDFDLVVPVDDDAVVGLLMSTTAAPYVIRNRGKGPDREVPWRQATRIRPARREELIRMLSPVRSRPSFEVLAASLILWVTGDRATWQFEAILYMDRLLDGDAVIPFHRSRATARLPWIDIELERLDVTPQMRGDDMQLRVARASDATRSMPEPKGQVTISQPIRVRVTASLEVPPGAAKEAVKATSIESRLELHVLELDSPVIVAVDLEGPTQRAITSPEKPGHFELAWAPPDLPAPHTLR